VSRLYDLIFEAKKVKFWQQLSVPSMIFASSGASAREARQRSTMGK